MPAYTFSNGRPTIAVLTNMMATPFSEGIIFGSTDYAKEHGYNVLCFTGAEFAKPAPINMSRHRIFDLVDKNLIDGLILPMGALSRFITLEEQIAFLKQFDGIPVITIASDIPGYQDVGYSPEKGMFELVEHLVKMHAIKRFAFAGVTGVHLSTIIKKQFFKEALKAHGIEFNEAMSVTSDMRNNAPILGLDSLFNRDKQDWPEVIVCGTDKQAKEVLEALSNLNIRVPEDVAVTGSMGHEDGLFCSPPLTSILEPTYKLGWHAAEYVIAAIQKKPFSDNLVLPTSLIIRRSCGSQNVTKNSRLLFDALDQKKHKNCIIKQVNTSLEYILDTADPRKKENISPEMPRILSNLLQQDLQSNTDTKLLAKLNQAIESVIKTEAVFLLGQFALSIHHILIHNATGGITGQIESKLATSLFHLAQSSTEKASRYRSFQTEKYIGVMREIGIQLNSEFNLNEISHLLLSGLNISDCYISIFEELNHPDGLVSNVMATQNGKDLAASKQLYPALQLMPPEVKSDDEPYAFLIMPLSFKEDFLGFCTLNIGDRRGVVYESLLTLFSSSLKNQIHVRNLGDAEQKFRDIAHSASDWLWEIDKDSRFKYCSDGVKAVLGYDPNELIGKPFTDFLDRDDQSNTNKLMALMNANAELKDHEQRYEHKDNSVRVLLTTGKPIIKLGKIDGYRGAYKDLSKIKSQEERIRTLAYRDPLTGLANRTLFNDRLSVVMATAQRTNLKFAVVFVDLDGFKLINDSMGHDAGDMLLNEVSKLFTACLREGDTLARFGGDEFVAILPHIDNAKDAVIIVKRMIKIFSSPFTIRGQSVFVTASIGISVFPGDGDTAEALLKNADKAMYVSKQNGKNRFSFYELKHEDAINRTVLISNLLHQSLLADNFHLLFQPQINKDNKQLSGVEALIRLTDETGEFIGPAEFIPVAEEIGLIEKIGLWVFEAACKQQRQWMDCGYPLKCSINVSAKQFRNKNLAHEFISIIEAIQIDPTMITIEITENAIIDNEQRARDILNKLADYGLSIAIDDFGTGYASLSCLRKIPVDILKIDQSFVVDCDKNEENASIICAIIMMAKSLKLKVIAEGVEKIEHLDFFDQLDCDEVQGYYFSKPVPEHQIPVLINRMKAIV